MANYNIKINDSLIKKLSREIIGPIPAPKVMPSDRDYNRNREKQIPKGEE